LILLVLPLTSCGSAMPEEEIPVSADASLTRSGVVYCSDGTHLVPVNVTTNLSEDTPQQLLTSLQTFSSESAELSSVMPEGSSLAVSQDGTTANVSITGETAEMDAEQIVCSVVNTLTQCGSIDSVCFSVNGLSDKFGTVDISQPISEACLNPAYSIGEHEAFQVFFRNKNGLTVPVTKETSDPSAEVFIKAMMNVPEKYPELSSLFPAGTKLNSAALTDGTLTLDFSGEFYGVSALPADEAALLTAIDATCRQLDGVNRTVISVDGVEYIAQEKTASVCNVVSE
ncbi:MAG: GerMN domain-containing protein, partial [Christensenellaceae bacterium]|nr:GerMN domain-containing protein [Christensenellaceae bacterium]